MLIDQHSNYPTTASILIINPYRLLPNVAPDILTPCTSDDGRVTVELAARIRGFDEADNFFLLRVVIRLDGRHFPCSL